ncbi:MAG: RnfH family protein [Panacagrimonas sp.]
MTRLRVHIVFATPTQQHHEQVEAETGMTLGEVIRRSRLAWAIENTSDTPMQIGVFGRLRSLADPAADGDRIEIYRPLVADPKTSRRRRAARLRGDARPG